MAAAWSVFKLTTTSKPMTSVHKAGLGFVATGFVVGFLTPILGLQHFQKPIWIGLAVTCFVTIFVISLRGRTRNQPKSN